jgi:diguanylate cyclase (GGDEF)-like protein
MQSLSNTYANNERIILAYKDFGKVILMHPAIGIAIYLMFSGLLFTVDSTSIANTANIAIAGGFNLANYINIQYTSVFVILLMLCHALLLTRFANVDKTTDLSSWDSYSSIVMFTFGLIYAAALAYAAFILGSASFMFLTLVLTTVFSFVGFMMMASKGALLSFSGPIVAAVSLVFLFSQTTQAYVFCSFLVVFLGFITWSSKRIFKTIASEIEMREEAVDLQSQLTTTGAKLNGLVTTDKITGLYTRQFFERQFVIEYRRAKRSSLSLSVIVAEIDHFAEYETSFGTAQTEKTFGAIASLLKSITKRPGEIVAIYNNRAFVFLLPNVVSEEAEKFANIVQKTVLDLEFEHKVSKNPELSLVSLSTGVAELKSTSTLSRDELLEQAEKTLKPAHLTGAMLINPSHWFTFGAKTTT